MMIGSVKRMNRHSFNRIKLYNRFAIIYNGQPATPSLARRASGYATQKRKFLYYYVIASLSQLD